MRGGRLLGVAVLAGHLSVAQGMEARPPRISVRLSFLVVPFTPLLTLEARILGPLTLQGETNFARIHGLNVKWYLRKPMQEGYVFVGSALVRSSTLRPNGGSLVLPYAGYGYAWALRNNWTVDARAGLGPVLRADEFLPVFPVLKVGVGKSI
jgi:hypothetical protein